MSNKNWSDNTIQFPRLIAEAEAAGAFTPKVAEDMCNSMDLTMDELSEIVGRAQDEWEKIKGRC